MIKITEKHSWVPEICYEEYEESQLTGGLPFITVPSEKEMPAVLFFFGSKDTGEFEPDQDGNEQPIVEMELYQYGCMRYLKENLDVETYDKVRTALGLLKLSEATKRGKELSKNHATKIQDKLTK